MNPLKFQRLKDTQKYKLACALCLLTVGMDLIEAVDVMDAKDIEQLAWDACWRKLSEQCGHVKRDERQPLTVSE